MDKDTRNAIERATQRARKLLDEDFSSQLEGTFDVLKSGAVAAKGGAHLSVRQVYQRDKIVAAIEHKRAAGMTEAEAVTDYVRDAAFTTINRFAALKMLEARDLVQECISKGEQSAGYREFCGMVPGVALLPDAAGYRLYIESLFDELSTELKVLFDRRDAASVLWPKRQTFDYLLGVLNAADLAGVWNEDETIGWIYQFFNGSDERKQMREESQAPRNSRELAVRNQFFTPRYVVQFLTDNTLGRTWLQMRMGDTALAERCEYLVRDEEAVALRAKKDPRDLKVLDPACGSGHFLLYAFDLLLVIYEEAWRDQGGSVTSQLSGRSLREDYRDLAALRRAVPALIVQHNLHGLDIDPRCAQIAALALWLRAQRAFKDFGLPAEERTPITRTHIVVAEPMPGDVAMLDAFAASLEPPLLRDLFKKMVGEMRVAGELGALLRVEDGIAAELSRAREQFIKHQRTTGYLPGMEPVRPQGELDLSGIDDAQFFHKAEAIIVEALRRFAECAAGGARVRRRLFAGDTAQGVALIDLVQSSFDVVLMNPPFGEAAEGAQQYQKAGYPNSHQDIFQCFVERALELVENEAMVGVLSARTGFFMGDSEAWRTEVVWRNHLVLFADLGLGVLDDALVEAAAYVVQRGGREHSAILASRHLATRDKEASLRAAVKTWSLPEPHSADAFVVSQRVIERIPGAVFGYWAPPVFLDRFRVEQSFERHVGSVRQGLATADDFRFVRLAWEVPPEAIGPDRRWSRFAKGGEYSPPYDDIHLVVDWAKDGRLLRSFSRAFIRNDGYYHRAGATYTVRTASAFAAKVLPAGCVFSHNAQSWFVSDPNILLRSIVYFLCRVPQAYLEIAVGGGDIATSGSAARRYTTKVVHSIPAAVASGLNYPGFEEDCQALFHLVAHDQSLDETTCLFSGYDLHNYTNLRSAARQLTVNRQRLVTKALRASQRLDAAVAAAWGISDKEAEFIRSEVGPHPCEYDSDATPRAVGALLAIPVDEVIRHGVEKDGASRWLTKKSYFVDRRTELICHDLRCSPESVEQAVEALAGDPGQLAEDVLSYAVGVAFGRWDANSHGQSHVARFAHNPFAELPRRPPASLSPASPTIPILVDDAGHSRSIVSAVERTIRAIWPAHSGDACHEIATTLGVDTALYLRREFFARHIARYSKSRRSAPIYWQLATRSSGYSVWLYVHAISRDTIFTVQSEYVASKLAHEERKHTALVQAVDPSPTASQRKEIAAQETLVEELRAMLDEVKRVAPLWNPHLDDGIVLTMAPLWRLVPQHKHWQKELRAAWDALCAGKYDWAHLAMHLWPERIIPKCATDRSLAIAHGLEDVFWVEGTDGKWKPRSAPTRPVEELVRERTSSTVKAALKSLLEPPVATAPGGRGRRTATAAVDGGTR